MTVERAQEVYLNDVMSCSLIVYDLHSADVEEVEKAIRSASRGTRSGSFSNSFSLVDDFMS